MDKIAEIRDVVEHRRSHSYYEMVYNENHEKYIRFLLDELERERAAHNAHVTELCQLEEETRKLLEERDEARSKAEEAWKEIDSLEEQLLSSQQEIERLREERDKLIEGLHNYMKELDRRGQKAYQNSVIDSDHHQLGMAEAYEVAERRLRDILKEIGVTVE